MNITGVETSSGNLIENGNQIRLYYHMDYLGTADYLTSPVTGKVTSWTHYNEWGEITHNAVLKTGQRELDLVKRYATHDYDAVLGMYYAKARMYDAENRRFAAMDPVKGRITEPITMVQYLYVVDDPLRWVDPAGRVAHNPGDIISPDSIGRVTTGITPDTSTPGEKIINDAAKGVSGAYKEFTSGASKASSSVVNGLEGAENGLQNAEAILRTVDTIAVFGGEVEVSAVVTPIAGFLSEARVVISNLKSGAQALDAVIQINNDGANKAYAAILNEDYSGALQAYLDVVPQAGMELFDCSMQETAKAATESFFHKVIDSLIDTWFSDQKVASQSFLKEDGTIDWDTWAPNNGVLEGTTPKTVTLQPGTLIDRYGPPSGKYVAPLGTPYEQRALPYVQNPFSYHIYKICKPISVEESIAGPAFYQPGGGTQYRLPSNVATLLQEGYLVELRWR